MRPSSASTARRRRWSKARCWSAGCTCCRRDKVEAEMAYLQIAIDKTAGARRARGLGLAAARRWRRHRAAGGERHDGTHAPAGQRAQCRRGAARGRRRRRLHRPEGAGARRARRRCRWRRSAPIVAALRSAASRPAGQRHDRRPADGTTSSRIARARRGGGRVRRRLRQGRHRARAAAPARCSIALAACGRAGGAGVHRRPRPRRSAPSRAPARWAFPALMARHRRQARRQPVRRAAAWHELRRFVAPARSAGVLVGLAGALRAAHADALAALAPDFAGFRSAVCRGERSDALDAQCLQDLVRVDALRAHAAQRVAEPRLAEQQRAHARQFGAVHRRRSGRPRLRQCREAAVEHAGWRSARPGWRPGRSAQDFTTTRRSALSRRARSSAMLSELTSQLVLRVRLLAQQFEGQPQRGVAAVQHARGARPCCAPAAAPGSGRAAGRPICAIASTAMLCACRSSKCQCACARRTSSAKPPPPHDQRDAAAAELGQQFQPLRQHRVGVQAAADLDDPHQACSCSYSAATATRRRAHLDPAAPRPSAAPRRDARHVAARRPRQRQPGRGSQRRARGRRRSRRATTVASPAQVVRRPRRARSGRAARPAARRARPARRPATAPALPSRSSRPIMRASRCARVRGSPWRALSALGCWSCAGSSSPVRR